ncbi:hypothetical protein [Arthrobacter sp. LjRoot14]|uniref:hypothetical protein n=1 Tax=Arthrobacter sp. LjRoot14 TaxID=3342265 RepID=UPI003ED034F8
MNFDDARAKLVEQYKRAGHAVRDGAVAAELAWTTLGSPVPVPQQPSLDQTREAAISWQIDNPPSIQQQAQNFADHDERLQDERRRKAFEDSLALREPDSREERPRERGR